MDIEKTMELFEQVQENVSQTVPDWSIYTVMQINPIDGVIFYNISKGCPSEKYEQIESAIIKNASEFGLLITTEIE